jgi:hypothetical protein
MRMYTTLRPGAVAAVIVTGLALFASALQGVARMDTSLEVAASRATPDRALVLETADHRDCPYRERSDRV